MSESEESELRRPMTVRSIAVLCLAVAWAGSRAATPEELADAPLLPPSAGMTLGAHRSPAAPSLYPSRAGLGDAARSAALAPARHSGSFLSAYVAPRVAARLADLDGVVGSPAFREEPTASAWREDLSRTAGKRALGALRGAARRYLVERWDLDLDIRSRGGGISIERARDGRRPGLRLGFAGLRPRLTFESPAGAGALKLCLDASGRLGVAWGGDATREASFGATLDPGSGSLEAGWRSSF